MGGKGRAACARVLCGAQHDKMFSGMFDQDSSSTISFNEFKSLWQFITEWEKVFRGFDQDKSGSIDRNEFKQALTSFGNEKRREREERRVLCANIYPLIDR